MKFDLFCSLSQAASEDELPSEKKILENFLSQAKLADDLGFETLWLAESHLSSETQKKNKAPVMPHFRGEVGVNTDSLQLAHLVFSQTKKIQLGTAIRNIICNGGPLAHAEAVRTFSFLQQFTPFHERKLNLGLASGRFEYSNRPYFVRPRDEFEQTHWRFVKSKVLREAVQIFLRGVLGHEFSSSEVESSFLRKEEVKEEALWGSMTEKAIESGGYEVSQNAIQLKKWWDFEKIKVIPNEAPLNHLDFYLGSHSSEIQNLATSITPCKVFNLSITSSQVIEETHGRMSKAYEEAELSWKREYMPRTVMIYLNGQKSLSAKEQSKRAREHATRALSSYWKAIEGTLDPSKVEKATENTLYGSPEEVLEKIQKRFHPEDRLMLWFDLNCHDNDLITHSMRTFHEEVAPHL